MQPVLVSDAAIVEARRILWEEFRIVVEHGASAALISGVYRPDAGERCVVVLCGVNTDQSTLTGRRSEERPLVET